MLNAAKGIRFTAVIALVALAAASLLACTNAKVDSDAETASQANASNSTKASNSETGLTPIASGAEPIYVLTRYEQTSAAGYNSVVTYSSDENGNYTEYRVNQYESQYGFDADGFATSVTATNDSTSTIAFTAEITNTFDGSGRLSQSQTESNGGNITAEFEYFGDTDNISSIKYSGLTKVHDNSLGYLQYARQFEPLLHIHAEASENQMSAKGRGIADVDSIEGIFSEDGALASISYDGETVSVDALSISERANQTIDIMGSEENSSLTIEYDENGNMHTLTQDFGADGLQQSSTTYFYKHVDTPSRAASVFGRLAYRL